MLFRQGEGEKSGYSSFTPDHRGTDRVLYLVNARFLSSMAMWTASEKKSNAIDCSSNCS